MTKVYTKIEGKLAVYDVGSNDTAVAIKTVRDELGVKHKPTILAIVPKKEELVPSVKQDYTNLNFTGYIKVG